MYYLSQLMIVAVLLVGTPAISQLVIPTGNLPGEGDAFTIGIDRLPVSIEPLSPDAGQRWDFTSLQTPYARKFVWTKASGNQQIIGPGPNFSEGLYLRTAGELRLQQTVGQDPFGLSPKARMVYSPAMPVRKLPQRLGSSFQYSGIATVTASAADVPVELLRKLPFRGADSIRLKVNVKLLSETDAAGKVLIPGGIFQVLREKHTYTYDFQVEVKVGQRRWQNISSMQKVKELFPKTTSISYFFWSDDALEPVAALTMDENGTNTKKVEFKVMDLEETLVLKSETPDFFVYPNPAIGVVRLEFFALPPGDYEIFFSDMIGNVHIQKKYSIPGNRIEKLDISSLAKGPYFYYIKDERGILVGKKKRLLVIRP